MAIVQIDYTTIQNRQNSRRFLCIINNSRHYAQKTSALLYIFVHNDGSCAVCTKNDRNVEAFCAKQKKLQFCNTCYKRLQNGYKSVTSAGRLRPRRRFAWFIVLPIYYIRVKELQKELRLELHRARARANNKNKSICVSEELRFRTPRRYALPLCLAAARIKIKLLYFIPFTKQ